MRNTIKIFVAMPIIAIALSSTILFADKTPIKISYTIIGLKTEYMRGERIAAIINIRNVSDKQIQYKFETIDGFYMFDSDNNLYSPPVFIAGWQETNILGVNGESINWPNLEESSSKNPESGYFLKPDKYRTYVKIKYKDESGNWLYVNSDTFIFSVVEPKDTDKEAYERYGQASTADPKNQMKAFEEFYKKYPRSMYAPIAYNKYITFKEWDGLSNQLVMEECEKLIKQYPDYPRNHTLVLRIVAGFIRSGKAGSINRKLESLKVFAKNARTNVLKDAIREQLLKYKKQ
jgi:hypothetical protein